MLDGRIYRAGLILAALALVVLGFSLRSGQPALTPTLAPEAFSAQDVSSTISALATAAPDPAPGSQSDDDMATYVNAAFSADRLNPRITTFDGRTVAGTRPLEDVVGSWPGMKSGSIVIVASRDMPGAAGLSGTATLLELGHDLQGETLNRTVVLASTSGTEGLSGAIHVASQLAGPVDAVIVLGDVGGTQVHQPVVDPWSTNELLAPPQLVRTLQATLATQQAPGAGNASLAAQFSHLAFPFTLGQQAPFNADGIPAVQLSLSGERAPASSDPISLTTLQSTGRAVLQTISAIDSGPAVPAPAPYLTLSGQTVPRWAISLFVLALLAPVALTTVDGVARARRRGHLIWRSLVVVIAGAAPFVAAIVVVLAARLFGLVSIAPPGPVAAGAVPVTGSGIAVLAVAGLAALAAAAGVVTLWRRLPAHGVRARSRAARSGHARDGTVAALLVAGCLVTLAIWRSNPYAALLLMPSLHLWLLAPRGDVPLPRAARVGLLVLGLVPVGLIVLYYAETLGYGPGALLWEATLLLAGHAVSLVAALEWSLAFGCIVTAVTLALLPRVRPGGLTPTPTAAPAPAPPPAIPSGVR